MGIEQRGRGLGGLLTWPALPRSCRGAPVLGWVRENADDVTVLTFYYGRPRWGGLLLGRKDSISQKPRDRARRFLYGSCPWDGARCSSPAAPRGVGAGCGAARGGGFPARLRGVDGRADLLLVSWGWRRRISWGRGGGKTHLKQLLRFGCLIKDRATRARFLREHRPQNVRFVVGSGFVYP